MVLLTTFELAPHIILHTVSRVYHADLHERLCADLGPRNAIIDLFS